MTPILKKILGAVALLAIGFALGAAVVSRFPAQPQSGDATFGAIVNDTLQIGYDVTQGLGKTLVLQNGRIVGGITQAASVVNYLLGVTLTNSLTQGASGWSSTITTTSTLTAAQMCATTNMRVANTTSSITVTMAPATTTFASNGCGGGTEQFGAWQNQLVTNDSTNTVTFVAGTGIQFLCETTGVGTTTVLGGCTSSTVAINPTSTVQTSGYWDGASSSMKITWGSEFH